ncbi:MAG: hypothetical protein ABIU05_13360 [Nitrospirales bacterium]
MKWASVIAGSTHPIDRSDKSDRQLHEEGVLMVATIWKRKDRDVWVADYRDATGKRIRLTAGTRPEAEGLLADKVKETRVSSRMRWSWMDCSQRILPWRSRRA